MADKLTKEWIVKNGRKLKQAYSFAVDNKLNINSEKDVLTILGAIDPENANKEYAEMFSKALRLFEATLNKTIRRNKLN